MMSACKKNFWKLVNYCSTIHPFWNQSNVDNKENSSCVFRIWVSLTLIGIIMFDPHGFLLEIVDFSSFIIDGKAQGACGVKLWQICWERFSGKNLHLLSGGLFKVRHRPACPASFLHKVNPRPKCVYTCKISLKQTMEITAGHRWKIKITTTLRWMPLSTSLIICWSTSKTPTGNVFQTNKQ